MTSAERWHGQSPHILHGHSHPVAEGKTTRGLAGVCEWQGTSTSGGAAPPGTVASFLLLAGQERGTTEMRDDGRQSPPSCQEIDEPGEGSKHLVCLVRGWAPHGFPAVAWAQAGRSGCRAIGERSNSLSDDRLSDGGGRALDQGAGLEEQSEGAL